MIVTLIFVFLVFIFFYHWKTLRPKNYPPGPPVYPFIGNVVNGIVPNLHFAIQEWREIYGPVIGLVFPGQLAVAVADPKMILECVKHDDLQGRFTSFTMNSIIKSKGIIMTTNDSLWAALRRFTLKNLRDLGFNKANAIEHQFEKWSDHIIIHGPIHQGETLFQLPTMNILWESISSVTPSYEDAEFNAITRSINDILRFATAVGFLSDVSPWFSKIAPKLTGYEKISARIKILRNYCEKEVERHRKTLDPKHPRDLIDAFLLEIEDSKFNGNDLFAVMVDLYFGGSDTVNNTLGFAVLQMIIYPDVQKKVQKEIDSVLGENQVTLIDRARLHFVEATLTEMKRCCPTVGFIPRQSNKDTTLNGFNIPKETNIILNVWSIYQDKERFVDPENFRPERFLDENKKFKRDDNLIFFGSGRRFCLGESLAKNLEFIFFVSLLQRFNLSLPEGEPKPSLTPISGGTLSPLPYKVKITLRNKK